jgi:hypothetical protein
MNRKRTVLFTQGNGISPVDHVAKVRHGRECNKYISFKLSIRLCHGSFICGGFHGCTSTILQGGRTARYCLRCSFTVIVAPGPPKFIRAKRQVLFYKKFRRFTITTARFPNEVACGQQGTIAKYQGLNVKL